MSRGALADLRLSRRDVLVAAATGSLLGSAWGTAFVAGELHADHPTATFLRSRDTFSLLLESRSRRLLLIEHRGEPPAGLVDDVTATILGLLRRRVDLVLVNDSLLETMSSAWRETWRVGMVATLTGTSSHPFEGNVVALGDLAVSLDRSQLDGVPTDTSWALTARHGGVVMVCGALWQAVEAAPRWPETTLTVAASLAGVPDVGSGVLGDVVIVPAEDVTSELAERVQSRGDRVARLYRDDPLTIELRADGVSLPGLAF